MYPAIQSLQRGDSETKLGECVRRELQELVTNLMCSNLRSVNNSGGKKISTWRLPFGPRSTGAIAYVLAQVHTSCNYNRNCTHLRLL